MHAQYLLVNNLQAQEMLSIEYRLRDGFGAVTNTYRRYCEQIEHLAAIFPAIRIAIFTKAFIEEPIDLCYLACLVVAA